MKFDQFDHLMKTTENDTIIRERVEDYSTNVISYMEVRFLRSSHPICLVPKQIGCLLVEIWASG